jgi:hypothetical protein
VILVVCIVSFCFFHLLLLFLSVSASVGNRWAHVFRNRSPSIALLLLLHLHCSRLELPRFGVVMLRLPFSSTLLH